MATTMPATRAASGPSAVADAASPLVRVFSSLDEMPADLRRTLDTSTSSDFHLTPAWIGNFLQTARDPGDQARLYSMESSNSAALMPMRSAAHDSITTPRVLHSLSNYYTCLFGPLLAGDADRAASLHAWATAVAAERPAWDMIRLNPLAHDGESFSLLRSALRAAGFATQDFFSFGNWYLPVEGRSFGEYLATRPSALQNTYRRKSKKLEQTGRARVEIATSLSGIEKAVSDYVRVYNASWKTPEPYPNFMPGLIRTCAAQGWLRLGLVYLDDAPIAAQLWIVRQGVASIYKLAYDEKFAAFSAGTILTARLMQHALDVDRVREVDYLSGDDDYKKTWMSHRRERWGILAFNRRTIRGALGIVRHIGGHKLKRAISNLSRRKESASSSAVNSEISKD